MVARAPENLAQRLGKRLSSLLPGVPAAFALARVLNLLGLEVARRSRKVHRANLVVDAAQQALDNARRNRDQAARQLRTLLIRLRRVIVCLFGKAGVERVLGGALRVPRRPRKTLELANTARRCFSRPRALPAPPVAGIEIQQTTIARSLEEPARALERALEQVSSREAGLRAARAARNDAIARARSLAQPTDRLLSSLDELAGDSD